MEQPRLARKPSRWRKEARLPLQAPWCRRPRSGPGSSRRKQTWTWGDPAFLRRCRCIPAKASAAAPITNIAFVSRLKRGTHARCLAQSTWQEEQGPFREPQLHYRTYGLQSRTTQIGPMMVHQPAQSLAAVPRVQRRQVVVACCLTATNMSDIIRLIRLI